MRSKRKKEDIKHTALGWIAISGLIAWWVYEPEWETQGYESKAIYQQAVSGGFESRAQFEEAKSAGFSSLSAWNAHRESERVAAIEKAERERIAKVEAQRIAERTARELESPLWRRLDGVPKALRGFWEVSDGCGVQYLESMGVYLSFAHFLGENGWYIASYQKPASGSLAERSPAYSDPRKLRTVGVIPLESFHFKATDGAEYVLTAKNRPGGAYAVDRLYKISGEHVTQLWGHMENGITIDPEQRVIDQIKDVPGSKFHIKDISKIGINDRAAYQKRCTLQDYADIQDETFYLVTGGTTTLRKIAEQL